jgi:hypothetical protein
MASQLFLLHPDAFNTPSAGLLREMEEERKMEDEWKSFLC